MKFLIINGPKLKYAWSKRNQSLRSKTLDEIKVFTNSKTKKLKEVNIDSEREQY